MKQTYILDTSVYLSDSNSLFNYGNNDIIIPLVVLEELDKHKKRQDSVGTNARSVIRKLDQLREKGSLSKGIRIDKRKGLLTSVGYNKEHAKSILPNDWNLDLPDNMILYVALAEKQNTSRKVIIVSQDINMRVKADSIGLFTEDYNTFQVIKDLDHVYSGFKIHLVDDQIIDRFYNNENIFLDKADIALYPNQFLMLISSANDKKTALARFKSYSQPLGQIKKKWTTKHDWLIEPRNKEQSFALELLMDPDIKIVTLIGKAGSGKTLAALAAGLQQTIEGNKKGINSSTEALYKAVIVSRPIQPLGRDIGFLPGSLEEKMAPWLSPIRDNLRYLMGGDKHAMDHYLDNGTIEIEALTYIRGRSIANAYMIIDEAQNLTMHELKTIITRVGEGTKIVLTGDIEQIDNVYVDETSNGLTIAVERFKESDITGHVTLDKGERSKVSTLASKLL